VANQVPMVFSPEAQECSAWPDPALRKAFEAYWKAALSGRTDETFRMEAAYVRQLIPEKRYAKTMDFLYQRNKPEAIEVAQPRARSSYLVEIPVKLRVPLPAKGLPLPTRVDFWVKTDSGWYHAQKPSVLFPELGLSVGPQGSHPEGKEVKTE